MCVRENVVGKEGVERVVYVYVYVCISPSTCTRVWIFPVDAEER